MDYQVWTKEEYVERWERVDCGDLEAAKREVEKAVRAGGEPVLTQEVYYAVSITLTEVKVETTKNKAKPSKGPGDEGEGEVRPGAAGAVSELDPGSGDPGADYSVPGK